MRLRARIARNLVWVIALIGAGIGQWGCSQGHLPRVSRILSPRPVTENPILIPSNDFDKVWSETVAVVDKYFDIASENRLSGTIITEPMVGGTIVEPWRGDSVGISDKIESTLQTIRRFAIINVERAPGGGHLVKVQVRKEIEDLVKPDRQAAGRAVFNNDFPVNRSREVVGPVPISQGWIPRGRDPNLEQVILSGMRDAFMF
jgi:hypothetical protein